MILRTLFFLSLLIFATGPAGALEHTVLVSSPNESSPNEFSPEAVARNTTLQDQPQQEDKKASRQAEREAKKAAKKAEKEARQAEKAAKKGKGSQEYRPTSPVREASQRTASPADNTASPGFGRPVDPPRGWSTQPMIPLTMSHFR